MNYVIDFPARRGPCRLTRPGLLRVTNKAVLLSSSCNMDLGPWAPSGRDSGEHDTRAGFRFWLTGKTYGIFRHLPPQQPADCASNHARLASHPRPSLPHPSIVVVTTQCSRLVLSRALSPTPSRCYTACLPGPRSAAPSAAHGKTLVC